MANKKVVKAGNDKPRQVKLSKEERSKIASEAATRRWEKKKAEALEVAIKAENEVQQKAANRAAKQTELPKPTPEIAQALEDHTAAIMKVNLEPAPQIEQVAPVQPPPPKPKRKKPMPKAFGAASSYAEKRLAEAIKERAEAMGKTAMLNAEIPSLVQIIRALGGQLPVDPQMLTPQAPVGYDMNTIMSDQPLPHVAPVMPTMPHVPGMGKGGGGAIGMELPDEPDEDTFLKDSAVNAGTWV